MKREKPQAEKSRQDGALGADSCGWCTVAREEEVRGS